MEYKILMGEAFREFNLVLIHEVQHAIQHIEGFAPGANVEQFKKIDELKRRVADFRRKAEASEKYRRYEEMNDEISHSLASGTDSDLDDWIKEHEAESNAIKSDPEFISINNEKLAIIREEGGHIDVIRVLKDPNDAKSWKSITTRDEARAFDTYRRTAGEAEARNASKRSTMSMEDRRTRLPDETLDVAPEDLIYLDREEGGEKQDAFSANGNSPWGEAHPEYSGQGSRAIDALRKIGHGWIPGLWSHKTIGDIALPYGITDEEARKRGYKTGYGLAHIDERHPDLDWSSVDKTIANGSIRQDGNRIILTDTNVEHKAVVQLTFDDQQGAWLVTAYKIVEENETGFLANPFSTAHGVYGDADNVTPRNPAGDNVSSDSEMSSGNTGNTGNTDIPHGRLGDFAYYVGNLQMPPQVALQLAGWEYVSRSPYSQSYYNMPGKSWENTPEGVIRISDHWNFESRNEVHCTTDSPVENNSHWTVAQYRNGVYHVLSSVPKLAPDAAKAISSKIEAESEEAARTAYPKAFSSRQTDGGLGINHWARNKKTGKIIGRIVESGGNPTVYNVDTIDGRQIKVLRANVETVSASDLPSAQKYAVNTQTNAVQKAETDENGRERTDTDGGNLRLSISDIWTGSAADYDKPSMHYVGTGEGYQVYGWGLYGASEREVGEWYARKDARNKTRYGCGIFPYGARRGI